MSAAEPLSDTECAVVTEAHAQMFGWLAQACEADIDYDVLFGDADGEPLSDAECAALADVLAWGVGESDHEAWTWTSWEALTSAMRLGRLRERLLWGLS